MNARRKHGDRRHRASQQAVGFSAAYFWPEVLGCAPYVTDIAVTLSQRCALSVIAGSPHYPRKAGFADGATGEVPGLVAPVRRIPMPDRSSGSLLARLRNDLLFAWHLSAAGSSTTSDVSVGLVPPALGLAALRANQASKPVVALVFDIESGLAFGRKTAIGRALTRLAHRAESWCLNRADLIIVPTQAMAFALRELGVATRIEVVPLWSRGDFPARLPSRSHPSESRPPTLLYSGALARRHGIEALVDVWSQLYARRRDLRLRVQGDGAMRDSVAKQLVSVGGNVEILPPASPDNYARSLREADLQFVLQCADYASFTVPSKVYAGLGAGLPFVSNAPPGSPVATLAEASGGGVVTDTASLAEATIALLDDLPLRCRMGDSAVAYARRHHDPKTLRERYADLILSEA